MPVENYTVLKITSFQLTTATVDGYLCENFRMTSDGGWTLNLPEDVDADAPDDLRDLVRYAATKGADVLDIHAENGFIDALPDWREIEEAA